MSDIEWCVVDNVSGSAIAEIIKGMLEAQGIKVVLSQEGIGESVFPVTVGPLSEIEILVPSSQLAEARQILEDYNSGKLENLTYPSQG
jgi:DeoR/GlpR family transcriptional regulator of sugar metabolism